MQNSHRPESVTKFCLICLLLATLAGLTTNLSAQSVTGSWDITMDFGGRPMYATLTIAKNSDGSYAGQWGSTDLSNVKFEADKLTFDIVRTMGDREFTTNYTATLAGDKLNITFSTPQGELQATGARAKPLAPAVGVWDLKFNIRDREMTARTVVSQKPDGALDAQWVADYGESTVTKVTYENDTLTINRKIKIQDQEFESTFTAKVNGNDLTGALQTAMGEIPVTGARFGADLIGNWELTTESEFGPRTQNLRVLPDLSGRYEFFGSEMPIELKLQDNQVTFQIVFGTGDRTFEMNFSGKLDGKTMTGEMVTSRGTNKVTGKKILSAGSAVGSWEFTRVSDRGTFTSILKINPDKTATYSMRENETPVDELTIDGNQVAFKVTRSFNDRQFTMEFKGQVDGDTLKGLWITERGEREVEAKRKTD